MPRVPVVAAAVLCVTVFLPAHQNVSPELQALAEAEQAFAQAVTVKGLRDASLEYFADDAVAFTPEATPAKERLREEPSQPFSRLEVTWEPRIGDVAASNDLGWLTGPSTTIDHETLYAKPRYANYVSVWKRQPDGAWRVHIRADVQLPAPPSFPSELGRMSLAKSYSGPDGKEASTRALEYVDAALNKRIAAETAGRPYASLLTDLSRLYRYNFMPVIGRGAITRWLNQNTPEMSASQTAAEASSAGDLGYTYGTYGLKGDRPQSGVYLRVWARDASGRWVILTDATHPAESAGSGVAHTRVRARTVPPLSSTAS